MRVSIEEIFPHFYIGVSLASVVDEDEERVIAWIFSIGLLFHVINISMEV